MQSKLRVRCFSPLSLIIPPLSILSRHHHHQHNNNNINRTGNEQKGKKNDKINGKRASEAGLKRRPHRMAHDFTLNKLCKEEEIENRFT